VVPIILVIVIVFSVVLCVIYRKKLFKKKKQQEALDKMKAIREGTAPMIQGGPTSHEMTSHFHIPEEDRNDPSSGMTHLDSSLADRAHSGLKAMPKGKSLDPLQLNVMMQRMN
jgi:hypothetical protein